MSVGMGEEGRPLYMYMYMCIYNVMYNIYIYDKQKTSAVDVTALCRDHKYPICWSNLLVQEICLANSELMM